MQGFRRCSRLIERKVSARLTGPWKGPGPQARSGKVSADTCCGHGRSGSRSALIFPLRQVHAFTLGCFFKNYGF